MRKLIAGMKISLDQSTVGPDGHADWVDSWADDYGLSPDEIDACLLGGGMYTGYEQYWTAVADAPDLPLPMTERLPTPRELDWSRFARQTPHYVLSKTLETVSWDNTSLLRNLSDVEDLKKQSGKDIYLVGGATLVTSLIEKGLVNEVRLLVYPLIAGGGKPLFELAHQRLNLQLIKFEPMDSGRVRLDYALSGGLG